MRQSKLVFIHVITLLLSACIPIPIKKEYITIPRVTFIVSDSSIKSVDSSQVILTTLRYPYGKLFRLDTFYLEPDGHLSIRQEVKKETVMPLMMHGVHEYSFSFKIKTKTDSVTFGYNQDTLGIFRTYYPTQEIIQQRNDTVWVSF